MCDLEMTYSSASSLKPRQRNILLADNIAEPLSILQLYLMVREVATVQPTALI